MKKILITAKHSYIGNSFAKWVEGKYDIDFISCRNDEWKNSDFSQYDVVFHVAGIAHVSTKANMKNLYYKVNRDLTIELAKKAKLDGVKQFVFMSSIIVFGESNIKNRSLVITKNTQPNPCGFYGRSKLEAEEGILPLNDNEFHIVIIRPPMVYGKNSKGNFSKLSRLARCIPMFPSIQNKRSIIYIDNLCQFIMLMIENEEEGTFHPQNKEYVSSLEIVINIAKLYGKNVRPISLFNTLIYFMCSRVDIVNKVFGVLIYEDSISYYDKEYCVYSFDESIQLTEGNI